ncbi:MAG: hypothetical protein IIZ11_00130 [Erysipelotrichaceae bacterium]|nr:hypothetical protein [Erysipelotrichaceae bacterium]
MRKIILLIMVLLLLGCTGNNDKPEEPEQGFDPEKIIDSLQGDYLSTEIIKVFCFSDVSNAYTRETSLRIEGTHVIFEDYDNSCYEPELTLNIIEGDRFKEQGNPNWYFELTGSMNQVSNEFYGTMVDDKIILEVLVNTLTENMNAKESDHYIVLMEKGDVDNPIFHFISKLDPSISYPFMEASGKDLALVWINGPELLDQYVKKVVTIGEYPLDRYYVFPLNHHTLIELYSGTFDVEHMVFVDNQQIDVMMLNCGQGLRIDVTVPEGIPSNWLYVECNQQGTSSEIGYFNEMVGFISLSDN